MPPNQIESRSRSARSPALPTAITTRPQFASSPAMAVLTSGELAIDSAILRADDFDTAPSTMISTSLRAPSPSRATCSARLASRSEEHTSELQSLTNLVCRLLLAKKKHHNSSL